MFAAVGNPAGSCGNFTRGSCDGDSTTATAYVHSTCVGKANCTLQANIGTFNGGKDPCAGVVKHVEVEVACGQVQPPSPPLTPPEQHPSGMNPYPSNALPHWQAGIHTAQTYRCDHDYR